MEAKCNWCNFHCHFALCRFMLHRATFCACTCCTQVLQKVGAKTQRPWSVCVLIKDTITGTSFAFIEKKNDYRINLVSHSNFQAQRINDLVFYLKSVSYWKHTIKKSLKYYLRLSHIVVFKTIIHTISFKKIFQSHQTIKLQNQITNKINIKKYNVRLI